MQPYYVSDELLEAVFTKELVQDLQEIVGLDPFQEGMRIFFFENGRHDLDETLWNVEDIVIREIAETIEVYS